MENKKTFKDLLNDMPLAAIQEATSITGVIARSPEPDRFVMLTVNGGHVTLPIEAVIDYQRIGGSIGQEIVQLQVKTDQIPAEAMTALTHSPFPVGSFAAIAPFALATPRQLSDQTLAAMRAVSQSVGAVHTFNGDDKTPWLDGTHPIGNGRWTLDQ